MRTEYDIKTIENNFSTDFEMLISNLYYKVASNNKHACSN